MTRTARHDSDRRTATLTIAFNDSAAWSKRCADYVCSGVNDEVDIQEAWDALDDIGGGTCILLEGTANCLTSLTPRSNVVTKGQGWKTVIKIAAGASLDGGKFIWATDSALKENIVFRDFAIVDESGGGSNSPLDFDHLQGVLCENIWIKDARADAFHISGSLGAPLPKDITLRDCLATNWGVDSAQAGYEIDDGVENVLLDNCRAEGGRGSGFDIHMHAGGVQPKHIVLRRPVVKGLLAGSSAGISAYAVGGGTEPLDTDLVILEPYIEITAPIRAINWRDACGIKVKGGTILDSVVYLEVNEWRTADNIFDSLNISGAGSAVIDIQAGVARTRIRNINDPTRITDAGEDTTVDLDIESAALDLSGAAVDLIQYRAPAPCYLVGFTVFYTEASSVDAGVIIRVGKIQAGGGVVDDFYASVTSEVSQLIAYSKRYRPGDLTENLIAIGEVITVGTAGGKAGTGEVRVVLHISSAVGPLYAEALVEFMRVIPATGTFGTQPESVNDGTIATAGAANGIGQYAQVDFSRPAKITQWRQYGHAGNNADGVWKIEYQDVDGDWHDWVTGIATRGATWSGFDSSGGEVVAMAVRLACTTVDSSGWSNISELEVKY